MFIKMFKQKNIGCAYLYFYIHFIVEISCFYFLTNISKNQLIWLIPLVYDGLAFVPQSIMGYINDKYPKINFSLLGTFLITLSLILYGLTTLNHLIELILICIGNGLIHINGAEVTLKNSEGKLSHSAIFVAGGSFGVITGKLLAKYNYPIFLIIFLTLSMIPAIILSNTYKNSQKKYKCTKFNYANKKINPHIIVWLSVLVVIVRGYMGYGIPTSWNKTIIQTIILYTTMGLGKALGGILSDTLGVKKIALISTLLSIPFLIIGDRLMLISLIGVMLFSMTMSITLGLLVSSLKNTPGLAFGLTTIGLFLGTVPIFFIKITNSILNSILIIVLSVLCSYILNKILEDRND